VERVPSLAPRPPRADDVEGARGMAAATTTAVDWPLAGAAAAARLPHQARGPPRPVPPPLCRRRRRRLGWHILLAPAQCRRHRRVEVARPHARNIQVTLPRRRSGPVLGVTNGPWAPGAALQHPPPRRARCREDAAGWAPLAGNRSRP
jgi:hypothetical protein